MRAVMNYAAAFAFTAIFTVITKQAVGAREREKKLREEVEAANRQLRDHAAQADDLDIRVVVHGNAVELGLVFSLQIKHN